MCLNEKKKFVLFSFGFLHKLCVILVSEKRKMKWKQGQGVEYWKICVQYFRFIEYWIRDAYHIFNLKIFGKKFANEKNNIQWKVNHWKSMDIFYFHQLN